MRGSYRTSYFIMIAAFALWLCVFGQELTLWAVASLLVCVVGGFAWLGFRNVDSPSGDGPKSRSAKMLIFLGIIILLDIFSGRPRMPEIGMQIVLVSLLGLRLAGKI